MTTITKEWLQQTIAEFENTRLKDCKKRFLATLR